MDHVQELLPVLTAAAERFRRSFERFHAWHGGEGITEGVTEGITEANITFQVASAFLAAAWLFRKGDFQEGHSIAVGVIAVPKTEIETIALKHREPPRRRKT